MRDAARPPRRRGRRVGGGRASSSRIATRRTSSAPPRSSREELPGVARLRLASDHAGVARVRADEHHRGERLHPAHRWTATSGAFERAASAGAASAASCSSRSPTAARSRSRRRRSKPVHTIESGPAAGAIGCASLGASRSAGGPAHLLRHGRHDGEVRHRRARRSSRPRDEYHVDGRPGCRIPVDRHHAR